MSYNLSDWRCHDDSDPVRLSEAAILPPSPSTIVYHPSEPSNCSFTLTGEFTTDNAVIFHTPMIDSIPSIPIYSECIAGSCSCVHYIGGNQAQLKPCRSAQFLFGDNKLDSLDSNEQFYIWNGLMNGFSIVDDDCLATYECTNYDSILAEDAHSEMTALLEQELLDHKVILTDQRPRCIHSLGAVWKSSGALRPITDCSRPDGVSINNFMSTTFQSFTYNSVQDAVDRLAVGDFMAVVDIAAAYRSVSVRDDDTRFQGLSWDFGSGPVYLRDLRLCFGLRCAPTIFDHLSGFIVKIANARGAINVTNYLDDFLVSANDSSSCLQARDIVTSTIELLGFQVSWKKVTEPSTITTFLGISIDSIKFELSLPMEKVVKLKSTISTVLSRGHTSKKELERLGGLVSYCSYVVRGGRTFSRRIFDLSASYSRHSSRIPLSDAIKDDLHWWSSFCDTFNGRACIIRNTHPVPMYSDASFMGFGAWLGKDWIFGVWDEPSTPPIDPGCGHLSAPPEAGVPRNINVCELWPLVVGLKRWGPHFANFRVHLITDNMQVLAMINTGRSCNRICMSWLRELFWLCFIWNFDIFATYIKSEDNVLADALSRVSYSGVPEKCLNLLQSSNMCCSSYSRTDVDSSHQTPRGPPRISNGGLHKEGPHVPN